MTAATRVALAATVLASVLASGVLGACSGEDPPTAEDPASPDPTTATASPTVGSYPEFAAEDYAYLLEQLCYCPVTGPVRVTVENGEVVSAVLVNGAPGMPKGSDAPEYLELTINDVIARANDTDAADVQVVWPEGQDWPRRVSVDRIANAVDDEVTYVVRDVRIV